MSHIQTGFVKDLHAKCYLTEKEALVTSLNLYDYSMIHNIEMGVFVSTKGWLPSEKDKSLHRAIGMKLSGSLGKRRCPLRPHRQLRQSGVADVLRPKVSLQRLRSEKSR